MKKLYFNTQHNRSSSFRSTDHFLGWSQLCSPCTVIKARAKLATLVAGLNCSDLVASFLQFVILLAQM